MKYKYSDKVEPRIIASPYDGSPVKPKLKTRVLDGMQITEAHWICPTTGVFIRKGTVEIKKHSKKKDLVNEQSTSSDIYDALVVENNLKSLRSQFDEGLWDATKMLGRGLKNLFWKQSLRKNWDDIKDPDTYKRFMDEIGKTKGSDIEEPARELGGKIAGAGRGAVQGWKDPESTLPPEDAPTSGPESTLPPEDVPAPDPGTGGPHRKLDPGEAERRIRQAEDDGKLDAYWAESIRRTVRDFANVMTLPDLERLIASNSQDSSAEDEAIDSIRHSAPSDDKKSTGLKKNKKKKEKGYSKARSRAKAKVAKRKKKFKKAKDSLDHGARSLDLWSTRDDRYEKAKKKLKKAKKQLRRLPRESLQPRLVTLLSGTG